MNAFERRQDESLERLDAELFGDLERAGRPAVLRLEEIRTDGGTQPRAALNQDVISDYAEAVLGGAQFPPVDVFYDGQRYWLADGFHRYHAHRGAGRDTIWAVTHQGTQRAAQLFSAGVNAEHGLRRTNDDKRRAVMVLLNDAEWSQWSDREIARQCRVSQPFVSGLRKELSDKDYQMERTVKRGDSTYQMKTGGINEGRARGEVRRDQVDPVWDGYEETAHKATVTGRRAESPLRRSVDRLRDQVESEPDNVPRELLKVDLDELDEIATATEVAGDINLRADYVFSALMAPLDVTQLRLLARLPLEQRGELSRKMNELRNMLVAEINYIDHVRTALEGSKS